MLGFMLVGCSVAQELLGGFRTMLVVILVLSSVVPRLDLEVSKREIYLDFSAESGVFLASKVVSVVFGN